MAADFGCPNFKYSLARSCRAITVVHFGSKLSKVIGEDGAVGSGVGVGVADGIGVGNAEGVGVAFGFAIGRFCHTSFCPTFLQIKEPEMELSFGHFAPTFAVAPCEIAGTPTKRANESNRAILRLFMGEQSQMWSQKVKMSSGCFKVVG